MPVPNPIGNPMPLFYKLREKALSNASDHLKVFIKGLCTEEGRKEQLVWLYKLGSVWLFSLQPKNLIFYQREFALSSVDLVLTALGQFSQLTINNSFDQ